MPFKVRFRQRAYRYLLGSLLVVWAGSSMGQADSQRIKVWPADTWITVGGSYFYKTIGELLGEYNSAYEQNYRACAQGDSYFCVKVVWEGIHPGPLWPLKINGSYTQYWIKSTLYYVCAGPSCGPGSSYTDTSDAYSVRRQPVCREGYFSEVTYIGGDPNNQEMKCAKYEVPPMQCSVADRSSPNDPIGGGKSSGNGSPGGVGNPIQITNGVKTESHTDYVGADGLLSLRRSFLGQSKGWRMPGDVELLDAYTSLPAAGPILETQLFPVGAYAGQRFTLEFPYARSSSYGEVLAANTDSSYTRYTANAAGEFAVGTSGERIEKLATATPEGAVWRRTSAYDVVEEFGLDGRIRKRQLRNGLAVTYQYLGGKLSQMQDSFGRRIALNRNEEGSLASATLPDGRVVSYEYANGVLARVTYPGGGSRQFLYNEPAHVAGEPAPYSLTGTIDENGDRIGTYKYNVSKQAISTETSGGADKYTLQYGGSYTQIVAPSGATHLQYFTNANGRLSVSSVNQPAGSGCSAAYSAFTYDDNGNVASRTDFSGERTVYTYDLARNLETSRTEAVGTPQARTISTLWHPSYRLPTKIAEPLRLITSVYDASGNLLSQTEQATTDATGSQGFAAVASGTPRTTRYTYNTLGKVLTVTDPNNRVTSYSYYSDTAFTGADPDAIGHTVGDLQSITNAAGHVTRFTLYDKAGRVRQSVDAKGITTDTAYTPRGWLSSTTVTPPGGAARSTSYSYDAVGQLKVVTQPDGATVTYSYDPAHRLIGIKDAKGNEISYTLDNAGNRTAEQIKDPSGVLQRSISRTFDALNRLQQVSGAAQ